MGRGRTRHGTKPFVSVPWEMLNSAAYKELNHSARGCLAYWLGKPKATIDKPGYCNEFTFPYPESERYGYAQGTFSRIIKELVKKGFVDPVDKGGLRGEGRSCNRYCLSYRWRKYGTSEFEAVTWESFEPRSNRKPLQKRKRTTPEMEIKAAV